MKKYVKIAYIGGGSRAWARVLMSDLARQGKLEGEVFLYDIDRSAAVDNSKIGMLLQNSEKANSFWNYSVAENLREALIGADFVIISILPGTFREMQSDVHTPEKYGIFQSVGDTAGPGGILRAMRAVPMFEEIANAIEAYCPGAWVINYTNPMSMCLLTLYKVFPKIKAVGCCHEVFSTQKLLCDALRETEGVAGAERHTLQTKVCGINHFTFITDASYRGINLLPVYDKFVNKFYQTGYAANGNTDAYLTDVQGGANKVKFDLYRRYGVIAAAGDRHLAEFCPQNWYLKDRDLVHDFKFELTPVSWRVADQKSKMQKTKEILEGKEKFDVFETGEEGTNIILALSGFGDIVTNINYKNIGQYRSAPRGSIVEANMKISKDKVSIMYRCDLPSRLNALVLKELFNQQNTVDGCIKREKEKVFCSFVNESLCCCLTLKDASALFDEMISNTCEYLQDWPL